jgi:hypothetical protein
MNWLREVQEDATRHWRAGLRAPSKRRVCWGLAWLAEGGSRGAIYCTRTAPTLDSDDFRRGGSDHLEQLIEVKRLLQDGHRQH